MASFGRARRTQAGFFRPFAILLAISLVLLLSRNSEPVRQLATGATQLLVPIQRVLADVGVTSNRFVQAITEIQRLRTEDAALRADVDRLTLENVQLREAAFAAQQAAKLGEVAKTLKYETVAAPVIARDPSNILATIVLGAGSDSGIKVGHVVVSEQGLVGRVSEVGTNYSKVLLITDPSSTLSALVEGSRATGIVRGQYGDLLIMDWILQTEKVNVGDVVVSAGLGLGDELRSLYPKGLVVGRVLQLQNAEAAAYQRAIVAPAVDLRRLENVLVVRTTP
ncbi:MAG: rod shape-determining protein MreC [Chloroflexi bacterium]|nr:MAG: rod shape-determining protein MreC [Chloroflexota bacterium]TMB95135.1 MAG: rod shape-determining protein MreC [Chloroflexota bacterium]TMC33985.1 MAG: rod shape-determining protein MreC [Chloroflexota bacterium]TMC56645.1 MAG: rod shape-determining protein MreC [Chloroflexota bacterium]TME36848.1 MAG: rod shape-determining protein MreC [Chloroflexota bacterium]